MLAAGCCNRGPAASADRDAGPAIAVAGGDTITTAITTAVTISVAPAVATASSSTTTAPTSPSAPTVRERRGYRQGSHHQSEHEHTEPCHVAPPL